LLELTVERVEQPRIPDSDGRLVGEGQNEPDVVVSEGRADIPDDADHADELTVEGDGDS